MNAVELRSQMNFFFFFKESEENFTEKTKTIETPLLQNLGLYNPAKMGNNKYDH